MKEVLHVNGSTHQERHGATAAVDSILHDCGADINDYHQFANAAIAVWFELEAGKLQKFGQRLRDAGVTLTRTSVEDLEHFSAADPTTMVSGTLQITFFREETEPRVRLPGAHHVHGY